MKCYVSRLATAIREESVPASHGHECGAGAAGAYRRAPPGRHGHAGPLPGGLAAPLGHPGLITSR